RGIIHRDVKPQNMLISATNPDHLLLSDFGIAKLFDSSGEPTWMPMQPGNVPPNLSLTRADQIIGTLEYMAPEQLQQHPFDARADIYALGVVLFQMLTGQVPFRSTTLNGMLYQHAYVPLKPVRSVNPNTPEVLARITEKALAKLPEERFQSAQEMAQALEAALASAPAPIPHQQPLSGIIQPQNSAPRTTTVPPLQMPISAHPTSIIRTKKRFRPQNAATLILLILALALLGWRLLPVFGITLSQAPIGASLPTAFVDDFHNTQFQWIEGSANGLTATISNGKYLLTTDNTQATHFPYPSAVATLPANFTMTIQIAQDTGSNTLAYGLVFHLNHTGNQVSCYALVITSSGNYAVLRYDPGQSQPTPLQQGKLPTTYGSPGTMYTLQAIVKGNSMQFSINGQSIQINGAPITDATYKDGLPGLLVTGPTASFTVTKVQVSTS
ncbi:MAG TPA: serine/threonine-protein kinase, partial [Ktedonobacteraceae bacterium]|nr:serine/threonine-protein kinase [Ktedonobacteraceae bacterium]